MVLTDGGDVLLAADEGTGWQIVGAHPAGGAPWYGDEPRLVMVIGSDARVGGDQQTHRADSIHLLTANPSEGTGTILGFPRDSWVSTKHGTMKFSSLMSGRGPQVMVDQVVDTWDLPVEGYVVTGFEGFEDLMNQVGYLPIDLPRAIPNQAWWNGWPVGEQTLSPQRTLEYSRTRKGIPGGDLTRSANQGVVMLAVLQLLQMNDIVDTPEIVKLLLDHTWTSLTPTDLIQLGATVHALDPEAINNVVLPGNARLGRTGLGRPAHSRRRRDARPIWATTASWVKTTNRRRMTNRQRDHLLRQELRYPCRSRFDIGPNVFPAPRTANPLSDSTGSVRPACHAVVPVSPSMFVGPIRRSLKTSAFHNPPPRIASRRREEAAQPPPCRHLPVAEVLDEGDTEERQKVLETPVPPERDLLECDR